MACLQGSAKDVRVCLRAPGLQKGAGQAEGTPPPLLPEYMNVLHQAFSNDDKSNSLYLAIVYQVPAVVLSTWN